MQYFGFDKNIGQINTFGFGGDGGEVVNPEIPVPAVGEPLRFTTTNSKGNYELPIIIRIFEPTGTWELKESGVLVADSTGFYDTAKIAKKVVTDEWQKGAIELSLNSGAGANRSYELSGKAGNVRLANTPLLGSSNPDGIVTVTSFSTLLTHQKFFLKLITLTVPTVLPKNMTDLSGMFNGSNLFNQDISAWDTSHVTSMSFMFGQCFSFNQPIDNWDTSNVTNMDYFLYGCKVFNQPLNNLNTSKVTSMVGMLRELPLFNQPIDNWDTSNVTSMNTFIYEARKFNQDIGMFDVSKVTDMNFFAQGAYAFKQDLSKWCVSLIPTMPTNFGYSTQMMAAQLPKWGTCPPRPAPITIPSDYILRYDFNGNYLDESANVLNGVKAGEVSFVAGRKAGTQCANFNDGYIVTPSVLPINSNVVTLSFWAKATGEPKGVLFEISERAILNNVFAVDNTSGARLILADSDGTSNNWTYAEGLSSDAFNHYIVIVDRNKDGKNAQKLYKNNIDVSEPTSDFKDDIDIDFTNNVLYIGKRKLYQPFFGYIQDVRIYNRALNEVERMQLFNE